MTGIAKNRKGAVNDIGRRIGEDHPRAKLLDREIDLVFELREAGYTLAAIAQKMDVSKGCIWKILVGMRRGQVAERFL